MNRWRMARGAVQGLGLAGALTTRATAQQPANPPRTYLLFVASSVVDQVALVRFAPSGASIQHRTGIDLDLDAGAQLRGLATAPDGRSYYLTTGNGFPDGELLKVAIARDSSRIDRQPSDTVLGEEPLDGHPGDVQLSTDGTLAWVTNRGQDARDAGSVSVVYLAPMAEAARIRTCPGAAGSRLSADGQHHYSVCAETDQLIDIDTQHMRISRRFGLAPGHEQGIDRAAAADDSTMAPSCQPTALAVSADGGQVYVACGRSNDLVEIDAARWTLLRRYPGVPRPSALAITHDGRELIAASADAQAVTIVDAASGTIAARLVMSRRVPGTVAATVGAADPMLAFLAAAQWLPRRPADVAVSADDRYAFIAVAGAGSEPGSVEVIDLSTHTMVASVVVAPGPSAVACWKTDPAK